MDREGAPHLDGAQLDGALLDEVELIESQPLPERARAFGEVHERLARVLAAND